MSKRLSELTNAYPGAREINVLRVASAVAINQTVTIGADVYEASNGDGTITSGRIAVDLSAGGTKSTGTLTSDNTNVSDGDTVTIGSTVYRFKNTLAQAYDVKIGADADASLLNLIKAINASGTAGTHYYTGTVAHPLVTAATSVTSHAFAVTASYTGVGGDSIASTETSSHLSWGAATLGSGANPTAAQFSAAFVTAIGASQTQGIAAVSISNNEVLIYSIFPRANALACSETLTGTNNAWAAAAMYGGEAKAIKKHQAFSRVPNATEVALGTMHFLSDFTPTKVFVEVRVTSSGVVKAHDGALIISGNRITLDNTGSTDWAATDTVKVLAIE